MKNLILTALIGGLLLWAPVNQSRADDFAFSFGLASGGHHGGGYSFGVGYASGGYAAPLAPVAAVPLATYVAPGYPVYMTGYYGFPYYGYGYGYPYWGGYGYGYCGPRTVVVGKCGEPLAPKGYDYLGRSVGYYGGGGYYHGDGNHQGGGGNGNHGDGNHNGGGNGYHGDGNHQGGGGQPTPHNGGGGTNHATPQKALPVASYAPQRAVPTAKVAPGGYSVPRANPASAVAQRSMQPVTPPARVNVPTASKPQVNPASYAPRMPVGKPNAAPQQRGASQTPRGSGRR